MHYCAGLVILLFGCIICHNIEGFDDSILYDISWVSKDNNKPEYANLEYMIVTSSQKEKYKCMLPHIQEKEPNVSNSYDGPTPLELISPLFTQTACSFRLESYWTYEVCHGRFVRQYHEDREGKKVKIQEYILGKWEKNQYSTLLEQQKNLEIDKVPVKKVDGVSLPYFEITMGNGTLCELNQNKPRETKVLYLCYAHGKHEIYSLKEISTCVYEIIVLSPLLCAHPKYKPQESGEHSIDCMPLDDSPTKPRELLKIKAESNKFRRKADMDRIRLEFHPIDLNRKEETTPSKTPLDVSPVESFLAGKTCLNGGTGWWSYEFCYGKSVEQYHLHKDGSKISIKLGYFDKSKHLQWLSLHPHKKPKPVGQRTQLSHFYSGGDVCDKTGKPRQTEVKLKCSQNAKTSAVSLYLLEPRYCEYILGVESPLICKILDLADENGLIENVAENDIANEDSTVTIIRV
ncbi:endoplasmic reticulum lectin 1 [Agrilus planipennis]|uniref:Endoplasmic reticulum lectin 1 n=1 Tax=Agrilus planipennis TaxID=224129 RepID=A0A1W4X4H6_AGRPL|nr:endoplasmic reticulum lectin 1 [Agrilus planipennis]